MELREHVPRHYETYTGRVASDWEVARYNRIQDDINAWLRANREPPEWLLNESHQAMQLMAIPWSFWE